MSLVKNNRIPKFGDTFNIQLRAELFNILNRPNYANPLKAATQLFSAATAPSAAALPRRWLARRLRQQGRSQRPQPALGKPSLP